MSMYSDGHPSTGCHTAPGGRDARQQQQHQQGGEEEEDGEEDEGEEEQPSSHSPFLEHPFQDGSLSPCVELSCSAPAPAKVSWGDYESPPSSPPLYRQRTPRVEFIGMEDLERGEDGGGEHLKEVERDLKRLSRKGTDSRRYNQPRMSLLGKPLNYRAHKRDARYRRFQARVYNFLERPKDWRAISYHLLV